MIIFYHKVIATLTNWRVLLCLNQILQNNNGIELTKCTRMIQLIYYSIVFIVIFCANNNIYKTLVTFWMRDAMKMFWMTIWTNYCESFFHWYSIIGKFLVKTYAQVCRWLSCDQYSGTLTFNWFHVNYN